MYLTWRAGAAALESAAALCAALNLVYFLTRSLDADERASRRLAAAALALISVGVLIESIVFGALALSEEDTLDTASLFWVRLLLVAGTAAMSLLVVRRLVRR